MVFLSVSFRLFSGTCGKRTECSGSYTSFGTLQSVRFPVLAVRLPVLLRRLFRLSFVNHALHICGRLRLAVEPFVNCAVSSVVNHDVAAFDIEIMVSAEYIQSHVNPSCFIISYSEKEKYTDRVHFEN